jgi:hypothetical protein
VRSGNSARMLSIGMPPVTVITLGTSALSAWAGTVTTWLRPVVCCFGSPPRGRNGRGNPHQWWGVWHRPRRTFTWNPDVDPSWGCEPAIHRRGW